MPRSLRWISAASLAALLAVGGALLALDQRCRFQADDPGCALVELTALREQMIASGALGDLERIAVPDSPAQRRDRTVLSDMARLDIVEPPDLSVHEIRVVDLPESSERVAAVCARSRTGSFLVREGERTVEIAAREDRLLFVLHAHEGTGPGWRVAEVRTDC